MSSLVAINAGGAIGAEAVEKVAFTRTICKKMANLYNYSKCSIDKNDLGLFLESNDIASVNELIDVLEQGKKLLNYDILAIKTENKSALSYWATLFAAPFVSFYGCAGWSNEENKLWSSKSTLSEYFRYFRMAELNAEKEYMVDGKFDIAKYNRFYPKPAEYIMQNVYLYKALIVAGLIATPIAMYKLYDHYMLPYNKKKEIATIDAILEQIKLIQDEV